MKSNRHEAILKIIDENEVQTQEEIQVLLKKAGFDVTQATVSRDIKSLSLTKTQVDGKTSRYIQEKYAGQSKNVMKFRAVFCEAVISTDFANNIVVLKCHVGMGNAACAALDAMSFKEIVGTLAGDDTIFVLTRSESDAVATVEKIKGMISKK